ncbi:si:dkey-52l18.4 [Pimephales promelas]|nr:si:dkey-52l18.4 [Pimephales promelas]
MPDEFGEHLTRDQRPFLHTDSLQILQIPRSMLVLHLFSSLHSSACELCFVRASRAHKFVPEGSSLKLSCEVQCGVLSWTGGWVFQEMQSTGFTRLTPSERIKLSNYSSTANSTHLLVHIHNINQSDAGSYKCEITWTQRDLTSNGHVTYVNVTAAASVDSSGRNLSHRILLCLSASMCFPLVLGLVWCLTRDHPPPPPVPPRSYTSSKGAIHQPETEVSPGAAIV